MHFLKNQISGRSLQTITVDKMTVPKSFKLLMQTGVLLQLTLVQTQRNLRKMTNSMVLYFVRDLLIFTILILSIKSRLRQSSKERVIYLLGQWIKASIDLNSWVRLYFYHNYNLVSTFWRDAPNSMYWDVWSTKLIRTDEKGHQIGGVVGYGCLCEEPITRLGILYDSKNRSVSFYKNGICQGVAFTNVLSGHHPSLDVWF